MGESGERKKSVWMGSKKMCLFDTVVLTFNSCARFEKIGNCLFCKRKYCKMVMSSVEIAIFFDKYGPIWPTVPRLRIAGHLLKVVRIAIFTAHCALIEKQFCNPPKKFVPF